MDNQENIIGDLIAKSRKKKNLTQAELAKLMNVSDKTISAWETGKNYPDLYAIKSLSKYLDVDLISIFINRKTKIWKKGLKILLIIVNIILIVASFVFGFFYLNNYNRFKVYNVKIDSEQYVLDSGLVVITPNKIIFDLGSIKYNNELENINVSLYYVDDELKEEVISKYDYDFLYYECINNYENINNFIIEISYAETNKKIELSLLLEEKISNNKFIYRRKVEKLTAQEERLEILLNNVGYKKYDNNLYIKKYNDKNITYVYDRVKHIFSYTFIDNEFEKNCDYEIDENKISYYVLYDGYIVESFTYNDEQVLCEVGKCNDSQKMINLIMEEYSKLK